MNTKLCRRVLLAVCLLLPPLHAADGSLNFDGLDDYVEVPNFQNLGVTTEVTVEFWAKANTVKQQAAFMLAPDQNTNRFQAGISYTNGNTYWDFGDIGNGLGNEKGRAVVPNPSGVLGNWTHYALVSSSQGGGFMKIYVNGAEVTSVNHSSLFNTATPCALRIGGSTSFFFDGSLDDFRVWNVARGQADIQRDLALPLTGSEPGLRLYLKFDESRDIIAVNSATATGATYNGTWINGPIPSNLVRSTQTVTNTDDTGAGSLRQALADAAAASGPAVISFIPTLSGRTITLNSEIVLGSSVTIDAGNLDRGLTIHGGAGTNRIFSVNSGQSVALLGLTLAGGNGSGAADSGFGGAILNHGTLTLHRCTLAGNNGDFGGGVFNFGTATVDACTIAGNSATTAGGGLSSQGALTLTRSTFSGNSATDPGGDSTGGGAVNVALGTALLENCTITGNSAPDPDATGGGLRRGNGTVTIKNCIVAQNTAATAGTENLAGTITQTGANFTSGDPLLRPLGNYGGRMQTCPPLPGSPAINAAVAASFTADQRGFALTDPADLGAADFMVRLVNTKQDQNNGIEVGGVSLREAIDFTGWSDIIRFDPAVFNAVPPATNLLPINRTPGIGEGLILSNRQLTVDARDIPGGVTLTTNGLEMNYGLVLLAGGNIVAFHGLTFANGGGLSFIQGGAGLRVESGNTLTLTQCTFTGNKAPSGGAIFNSAGSTVSLANCTFSGNQAFTTSGGAIDNSGTLTLIHCTVAENQASNGSGGGINAPSGTLTLTHSIVAGNTAATLGPDLHHSGGTLTATGVNSLGNPADSSLSAGPTLLTGNALLAPLGNYGGTTQTQPPLAGSPAIDAAVGSALTTDQRGYSVVGVADIGAAEGGVFVNTAADELDMPAGANVSLREAVRDCPPGGWIGFRPGLSGQSIILGSDIFLTKSVTMDASALPKSVTVDGGAGSNRIFTVNSGQTIALNGLTLTGGNGTGTILPNISVNRGGAIQNGGTLTLTRCTFAGNSAIGGGAIYNLGSLSLSHCTISGNSAQGGTAIDNSGGGSIAATHCTVSGNLTVGGAAIYVGPGTMTLNNSIVAGNQGTMIDGGFTGTNNIISGNPILAPLGNYGGPIRTMALLPGSPARNAAVGSTITADQRGFPIVGTPDIGAYEAGTFTNFDAWAWETLPADATTPQHDATYDHDGDGYALLLEYAGQFSGTVPDGGSPMPFTRDPAGTLATLVMPYRPGAADLLYTIERSTTLGGTWTPVLSVNGATNTDLFHAGGVARVSSDANTITFTDTFIAGQPRVFYRLVVTRQ